MLFVFLMDVQMLQDRFSMEVPGGGAPEKAWGSVSPPCHGLSQGRAVWSSDTDSGFHQAGKESPGLTQNTIYENFRGKRRDHNNTEPRPRMAAAGVADLPEPESQDLNEKGQTSYQ